MFINKASELMEESSSFEMQSVFGNARPAWLCTFSNLRFPLRPALKRSASGRNKIACFRDIRLKKTNKDYLLKVIIQFVSHVLPASSENACSKWLEFGVIAEKPLRAMIILP